MNKEEIKEQILQRLFKRASYCNHCGRERCAGTHRTLFDRISREDVLWAINIQNHFGPDDKMD